MKKIIWVRQHYVGLNIHSFDETHFMVTFFTYRQQSPAHSSFFYHSLVERSEILFAINSVAIWVLKNRSEFRLIAYPKRPQRIFFGIEANFSIPFDL